jgi:GNAT superfamily N-acetyltransferase
MALLSEQRLYPNSRLLAETDPAAVGKALLVRRSTPDVAAPLRIELSPIDSERDWSLYAQYRILVEAGFGIGEARALAMVSNARLRTARLGLDLYFARDGETVIGAIGRFRLPSPYTYCARLQEVDVFPSWRNRGYGNALLAATFKLLASEGSTMVMVGADEDDWPLTWYRRRGFHVVARVPLSR